MAERCDDMAILAEMGTGKTGAMANILRRRAERLDMLPKTLILSPQVTLFNWRDELLKHTYINDSKMLVLHKQGSAGKIKQLEQELKNDPHKIVIVNYEALLSDKLYDYIINWGPQILICDESHYVKNHKAKRSKKVAQIADQAWQRFIMTGTPILNNPTDIFMQYRILDGGATFGKDFFVFNSTYMEDKNASWKGRGGSYFPDWQPRVDKFPELQRKMYRKAIRVTKDECLDLPPLIEETYKIPLSPKQRKYYDEMYRDFVTFVQEASKEGAVTAQLAVTKALRLQQIVTGFVQTEDGDIIEIKENPRLDAVKQLLLALHAEHKTIIWCSFRFNYKQLGKLCDNLGINHVFLTGEMNLKEKQDAMDTFRTDNTCRVIIANRRAGGIGVNLVEASYSIVYSRNFNLNDELQSAARNHRGGSEIHERVVKINLCAKDTIDEHVTEALGNKKNIADLIVEIAQGEL